MIYQELISLVGLNAMIKIQVIISWDITLTETIFPFQIAYIHYKYSNVAELAQTTKNIEYKTKKIKIKN